MNGSPRGEAYQCRTAVREKDRRGIDPSALTAEGSDETKPLRPRNQIVSRKPVEKQFAKIMNLGMHKLATEQITPLAVRTFLLLMRDASYGGVVYRQPIVFAEELGSHVVAVRKALRELQEHRFVVRQRTGSGGASYLLNPYYVQVGPTENMEALEQRWARAEKACEQPRARV